MKRKKPKKPQNIDNFYVIETEKGMYCHKDLESATRHKEALATNFGKHYEIHTLSQTTIFDLLNIPNTNQYICEVFYENNTRTTISNAVLPK